ncbi:MAG TPA: HlyD family type I secretion periplasmic adaptor subunit [Alphaproteobacteria bacterium]|nr:HlyD family type I secretion periplasmic adaptor subunit [Alphaproteobacteria bacterium]HNS45335.1 HlyD family type I secretion periplasmic adaptor subunit [Alphaproteobacteria bacterium]
MSWKFARDTEFMDDLDAMRYTKLNRASVAFLYAVLAFVATVTVWSAFAQVDEITRGSGEVVPSQNAQIVQSLEGGILQELLVRQGDHVKKGQVLMRLSDIAFASEERGTEAKLISLQTRKARLEAEANNTDLVIPDDIKTKMPKIAENEQNLFVSRKAEYKNALDMLDSKIDSINAQISEVDAQISSGSQSIGLLQKELGITSRMVAQKAVPQIEEIRLQRQLSDAQGAVKAARERKSSLASDLSAAQQQKKDQADKFRSQALGELNDTETQLSALKESLKTIGDRVDRTEIKSPVDGIVNNLSLTTIGGVVEPAMRLAEIVPVDDDLKIIARVSPNDIAFLKIGQPARVKITAYDSTRYGYLDGELTRIGANSIPQKDGSVLFEIEVHTHKNFLGAEDHPLPIMPGMVSEVDVITGQRSILEYFMKPLLRLKDRAFQER